MEKEVTIIWAPNAQRQADLAMTYCLKQFGKKTALRFANQLEKDCIRIKNNPFIGAPEYLLANRPKQYRSLIEGYYKLIYTIENEYIIHIVLLWDCRQDPDKLKQTIR
ncbi:MULTISPECIES: type II toxin-antitoxin system RelE/ParE family toxin [Parabacteroides]|uniref:type II toxin-antitoxin system RelE/ParE family toxin n=1 Tax=Parabacteroides leei TaxID=2939491 RepID=UPI00189A7123|nr:MULTISPECIES: type II toxin-antitoxin system RelE/ParE family toxin [Parabacteroides]MCL3852031.1 type II toxin-antitoxin system RelE/ParE family toxin [Parabacteroides leei]